MLAIRSEIIEFSKDKISRNRKLWNLQVTEQVMEANKYLNKTIWYDPNARQKTYVRIYKSIVRLVLT